MPLRRSLLSTLCTLVACLLIGVSAAPGATRAASNVEIVAPAESDHAPEAERRVAHAEQLERGAPAAPALFARADRASPRPRCERHAHVSRVYIAHCALLL